MGQFEVLWALVLMAAVLGAIGLFVGYLVNRNRNGAGRKAFDEPSSSELSSNRLYHLNNDLLLKVLGDQAKAKRLVEFERRKTPTNSEAEHVQAAIDRWERDNR